MSKRRKRDKKKRSELKASWKRHISKPIKEFYRTRGKWKGATEAAPE